MGPTGASLLVQKRSPLQVQGYRENSVGGLSTQSL
jgi:hypothetical protein